MHSLSPEKKNTLKNVCFIRLANKNKVKKKHIENLIDIFFLLFSEWYVPPSLGSEWMLETYAR